MGQGALALEVREADIALRNLLVPLNHADTAICIVAERGFQQTLESDCSVPAGALVIIENGRLKITGMIASADGAIVSCEIIFGDPQKDRTRAFLSSIIEAGRL